MYQKDIAFEILLARCAVAFLGLYLAGAGIVAATDQVFLEAATLSRDGPDLTVALPSGPVVLSATVVGACLSNSRNPGDILKFDLDTGVCQFIPFAERNASPLLSRPAVDHGGSGASSTILACLVARRGVLIVENSGIALCFDWYECGELVPVITGANLVCTGSSISLDAGSEFSSYLWEPGGETTQIIEVSPSTDTQYAVTVSDQWLCFGADTHLVTVVPLPQPDITGPAAVCLGGEVILEATPGFASYDWSPGGQTTQQIEVVPMITTGYTVTVTDANGCMGMSSEHVVDVTVCLSSIFDDDFETGDTSRWSSTVP